jgi:outer-membrane receptor for ferric coprogen and ferric-rhodotorulic acid
MNRVTFERKSRSCGFRLLMSSALLATSSLMAATQAQAQSAATAEYSFDIPAQSLTTAVLAFGQQGSVQMSIDAALMEGKTTGGVKGRLSVQQALAQLLAGTGLTYRFTGERTVTILTGTSDGGERVLGAVRIEGAGASPYFGGAGQAAGVNGVNGSRDITATEGTGSFTSGALTIGSKVAQSMKDVPQSVSVLTSERLEQQNVKDFQGAMRQLPGVSLVQGSTSLDQEFYSRGFQITDFQIDGGAPMSFGSRGGRGPSGLTNLIFSPQIDLSQYDHVEMLRGASGTFTGYGDPSGVLNLVRKKPLDHQQITLELQAGSWSDYRVVLDGTSPITADGKLRSRLVYTFEDKDYFYDTAHSNKKLFYNINEYDLTPTTLLTAGFSLTRQRSVPWNSGLPRYQAGGDLNLPRNTCLCFSWNRDVSDTNEFFGSIEQKIGKDWVIKISNTYSAYDQTRKLGYIDGTPVNAIDGQGPRLAGSYTSSRFHQNALEGTLNGAFSIFGQRQEISIGVNRSLSSNQGNYLYSSLISDGNPQNPYQPYPGGPAYCYSTDIGNPCPVGTVGPQTPLINVFNFDPSVPIYSEPPNPAPSIKFNASSITTTMAYINVRLTAFDRLHLTAGARWTQLVMKFGLSLNSLPIFSAGIKGHNLSWPPSVSLSFDITKSLTGYVGYTDIYQDQSTDITIDGKTINPIEGSNWEAGLKWAARDGKLNVSLAAYSIKQKNFSTLDPNSFRYDSNGNVTSIVDNTGFVWADADGSYNDGVHHCCYKNNPERVYVSRGYDLDITGEVLPGWQVATGFSYNKNFNQGTDFGDQNGQPFLTIAPKALPKMWTSYDFHAGGFKGWLSGMTVSAGVIGQSSGYYSGSVCVSPSTVKDPITHQSVCNDDPARSDDGFQPYAFTTKPYAVVSGRIDYRFTNNMSFSINVENLLDKIYYSAVGNTGSGNWYGAPRSVTASFRARF